MLKKMTQILTTVNLMQMISMTEKDLIKLSLLKILDSFLILKLKLEESGLHLVILGLDILIQIEVCP